MPSVSQAQQAKMGAAYQRKKAGHPLPDDPQMSLGRLKDFASTPTEKLPKRKMKYKVSVKKSSFK